ncbi:glycosyltransferase [Candidatus Saccharibacteria bacterium]|nr:glycosyltransferase [Candidatus Saccharibacteria bacterium]
MIKDLVLDVSVIIAFKDKAKMTATAASSFTRFGPAVKEIVLISNNSSDSELQEVKNLTKDLPNVKVIERNVPFNYHKIYNWGIKQSSGKFVIMMNNDVELVEQSVGLIEKMYRKASKPGVGVCGCTLIYGDKRHIQHAGVFLQPKGMADHMYIGELYRDVISNVSSTKFPYDIRNDLKMTAVTGAFQLVERKKIDSVGGLDERFIIGGGDVDLCIRMNKKSYQTWFVGGGYMIHKESMSRRHIPIPYSDFYYSYLSYITGYDASVGDPFLPKITRNFKYGEQ